MVRGSWIIKTIKTATCKNTITLFSKILCTVDNLLPIIYFLTD